MGRHCRKKPPVEVDNSRRREAEPRVAAVAAETSLSIARADKNEAPSLFTLTSQRTALPAASSTGLRAIVRIETHSKQQDRFKVMYGPRTDGWLWEKKQYLLSHPVCREQLIAYAEQHNIAL